MCLFFCQEGFTSLVIAALHGHTELFEELLKAGANSHHVTEVTAFAHCLFPKHSVVLRITGIHTGALKY